MGQGRLRLRHLGSADKSFHPPRAPSLRALRCPWLFRHILESEPAALLLSPVITVLPLSLRDAICYRSITRHLPVSPELASALLPRSRCLVRINQISGG